MRSKDTSTSGREEDVFRECGDPSRLRVCTGYAAGGARMHLLWLPPNIGRIFSDGATGQRFTLPSCVAFLLSSSSSPLRNRHQSRHGAYIEGNTRIRERASVRACESEQHDCESDFSSTGVRFIVPLLRF